MVDCVTLTQYVCAEVNRVSCELLAVGRADVMNSTSPAQAAARAKGRRDGPSRTCFDDN